METKGRFAVETAGARPKLILVGGGARSGKSRFALERAAALGGRRVFIATAEAGDDEMAARIDRHRRERDGAFHTIEEPVRLAGSISDACAAGDAAGVVVVDCLTLWVSNLLGRGAAAGDLEAAFTELEEALEQRRAHVILVTNEVGLGLVPETPLGRIFRDAIGDLHRRLAGRADEVFAGILGVLLRLRPGPIEAIVSGATPQP